MSLVTSASHSVNFTDILVSDNDGCVDQSYVSGISLASLSHSGTTSVVVSSALFKNNVGIALSLNATATVTTILLQKSLFVNNTPNVNYYESSGILLIKPGDRGKYVEVNLTDGYFSYNKYKGETVAQCIFLIPTKNINSCFQTVLFKIILPMVMELVYTLIIAIQSEIVTIQVC